MKYALLLVLLCGCSSKPAEPSKASRNAPKTDIASTSKDKVKRTYCVAECDRGRKECLATADGTAQQAVCKEASEACDLACGGRP